MTGGGLVAHVGTVVDGTDPPAGSGGHRGTQWAALSTKYARRSLRT